MTTVFAIRLDANLGDLVMVPSEGSRTEGVETGVPARELRVVWGCLSLPNELPAQADARKRLGIPGSADTFATNQSVEPYKGTADLLETATWPPDPEGTFRLVV